MTASEIWTTCRTISSMRSLSSSARTRTSKRVIRPVSTGSTTRLRRSRSYGTAESASRPSGRVAKASCGRAGEGDESPEREDQHDDADGHEPDAHAPDGEVAADGNEEEHGGEVDGDA